MSYRENAKPREPVLRQPAQWHRWTLAASLVGALVLAIVGDLGALAGMPMTAWVLGTFDVVVMCIAAGTIVGRHLAGVEW